ncbi:MAG: GDP-mannose 4,6-dehydratase [Pirellulales bacterium]|nr:GDP-mannose 4,6-dehydratase [Pirellulales bacterium]
MNEALRDKLAGSRCLITGGMGFIGSNLAIALVELGAEVTIADAMIPGYGGNLFNVEPIADRVTVNFCDIRDVHVMNYLVRDKDFVFHLAGQVDHIMSLTDPFPDIDINVKGTAVLMEACRHHAPGVKVIYTGTRGQYGRPQSLPVNEQAPTMPLGIYEITNLAAEKIIEAYHLVFNVRSVLLRITNTYGPRAQMLHSRYGVANWFVRLAIDDQTISVFGDGQIKRDLLFVDDCVEAILMAAASENAWGQVFNVGVDRPTTFIELAEAVIRAAGSGRWQLTPFSAERKAQEPGDFYSDITKIRSYLGWEPRTSLDAGMQRTVEYFRRHKAHYW